MSSQNYKLKIVIAAVLILIFASAAFYWFKNKGASDVIDTGAEIMKSEDEIGAIKIDSGGGKKEMVQIRFSWEASGIKYNDALYFTKDQYEKLTPKEIEKMKEERFQNWVKTVNGQSAK